MKKALIIGGGFSGCAAAHQLALLGGWDVTMVEAAPHLGAGVRTMWYGGHPHTFGPRHFLTPYEHIYEYLNSIIPLRSCADHEFLTYIERDERFYHFPIHRDDIPTMPDAGRIEEELQQVEGAAAAKNLEEFWIRSIGQTLYKKFIDGYSRKMWMLESNTLIDDFGWSPKGVTIKEGPRAAWDSARSAYPVAPNGYDDYFEVATAEAKVYLGTRIEKYDIPHKTVWLAGEKWTFDVIVSTISPDILFDFCYGELPYVGREFHRIVLPVEIAFPPHVYFCYYANAESFTRIVEYKKFTHHRSPTTLLGLEIPSRRNKLYPMPFEAEKAKAERYFSEMPDGVFSIGRAGSYRYNVDIDDTIDHAMKLAAQLSS
ncbi:MAG: FAD-dependent oxidoreductase [Myxococcota bacterium]